MAKKIVEAREKPLYFLLDPYVVFVFYSHRFTRFRRKSFKFFEVVQL